MPISKANTTIQRKISTDCIIGGAGSAGLLAAVILSSHGHRVTLLETQQQAGRKLLASGGGRCNLANTLDIPAFMAAFGRKGTFMRQALHAFSCDKLLALFQQLGVPLFSPDGVRLYPKSESSQTVLTTLINTCLKQGVQLLTGREIESIMTKDGIITGVRTKDGCITTAQAVLLATGGCGYPQLSDGRSGMTLAKQLGHQMIPPTPANVPLITRESWPHTLAGISLPEITLCVKQGKKKLLFTDSLLFTHRGISGPVVLNASGTISEGLHQQTDVNVHLRILTPSPILELRAKHGKKTVLNALSLFIPHALAATFCMLAEIPREMTCSTITKKQQLKLVELLTNCPLTIIGTEGFKKAMAMRGGVDLKDVNPRTLESRKLSNLYFAGEMLDLDGPCGGFMLRWAFSSAYLAAQSISAVLREKEVRQ